MFWSDEVGVVIRGGVNTKREYLWLQGERCKNTLIIAYNFHTARKTNMQVKLAPG